MKIIPAFLKKIKSCKKKSYHSPLLKEITWSMILAEGNEGDSDPGVLGEDNPNPINQNPITDFPPPFF